MMEPPERQDRKNLSEPGRTSPPKRIDARDLMGDSRELRIVHDGQEYRLSMTSKGKLILTK